MTDTATPPLFRLPRLRAHLPARRTWLKLMHGLMIPLVAWFVWATPENVERLWGPGGHAINSVIALGFVILCLIWSIDYFVRGLAGRPGPKLSPRLRTFHRWLHRALIWGIILVPVGGFLLGLTASRLLKAGTILPIAPPMDWPTANAIVGKLHIYEFYALAALATVHAGFHIWRHLRLKDNALRIMAPKILHRFL